MLKCAYINEMIKIAKKKKLIVAALLGTVFVAAIGLIFSLINNIAGVGMMFKGEFAVTVLPFFEYTLIPLFTAFIAIDMFGGEFSNDTIKLTLTRPVSRFKVYISKVLACATFLAAFLLYTMIVAIIVSLFSGITLSGVVKAVVAYVTAFVPLMIFTLMVMLISNFSRGTASAFLISVLAFLVFKGCEFCLPAFKAFFFTSAFDWYKLSLGTYYNFSKIIRLLLIFAGYGLTFLFSGFCLFDRRAI